MQVQGLLLVGQFVGVVPVMSNKTGTPTAVPGFFNVVVTNTRADGSTFERRASFSEYDRDSEDKTTAARALDALKLQPGEQIAVKVAASARKNSDFVNLDVIDVARIGAAEAARPKSAAA